MGGTVLHRFLIFIFSFFVLFLYFSARPHLGPSSGLGGGGQRFFFQPASSERGGPHSQASVLFVSTFFWVEKRVCLPRGGNKREGAKPKLAPLPLHLRAILFASSQNGSSFCCQPLLRGGRRHKNMPRCSPRGTAPLREG